MRIVFTHVCVLPQSGLEGATDCFVEALLCHITGRCRSVRAVVVAPSWPSVLAGRLTLDLLEYRNDLKQLLTCERRAVRTLRNVLKST